MGAEYNEAQKKASIKYLSEKTESIQIRVPKGKKSEYKDFAESQGTSLNKLICSLLDMAMDDKDFDPALTQHVKD